MAQQIEVLVKVLGENENAYKIETQDGETMWLSKRVVSNHGDTKVGFYITILQSVLASFKAVSWVRG